MTPEKALLVIEKTLRIEEKIQEQLTSLRELRMSLASEVSGERDPEESRLLAIMAERGDVEHLALAWAPGARVVPHPDMLILPPKADDGAA